VMARLADRKKAGRVRNDSAFFNSNHRLIFLLKVQALTQHPWISQFDCLRKGG
jgi:hypothetical protein